MLRFSRKTKIAPETSRHRIRRSGLFFATFLIVASVATSLLAQPLTQTAYADSTGSDKLKTLYDRAQSYAYLNALRWCIQESQGHLIDNSFAARRDRISEDDVQAGRWFQSNTAWDAIMGDPYRTAPSYLSASTDTDTDTDRGMAMCNSVLQEAIPLWGYSNGLELICDFVEYRADGQSSCENGTDNNFGPIHDYADEFYEAIKTKIYDGETPTLYETLKDGSQGHPGRYLLYKNAFERGCLATQVTSAADSRFYENIKIVADDGTYTEFDYEGINKNDARNVYIDRDDLRWLDIRCEDIAARVNEYADIYIKYRKFNLTESATGTPRDNCATTNTCDEEGSSCAIDGIGWIICPVVNFLGGLADGAFGVLADNFLRTDPQVFNTTEPTYRAWSVMRTIANVAFVIVFLIIIFSQLTSVGVSNYGVKKMLPRLIIGAVLVNLSYFISQAAVDLSNILGYSLKDVFEEITKLTLGGPNAAAAIGAQSPFASGEGFAGVAGIVVAGVVTGAALYAMLSALIPVLIAAVVGLIMIMLILVARQALIILLVIVSPLAFVAYLLPNTENLFKKWRQTLTAMLLLFPIVALIFGASTLASQVLSGTFSGGLEGDTDNWFGQIIAAAVLVLPLFVVPSLLKKSMDGIGGIGAKINGLGDRLGKAGGNAFTKSRAGQGLDYLKNKRDARNAQIRAGTYTGKGKVRQLRSRMNAAANSKMGGFGTRIAAQGIQAAEETLSKEQSAAKTLLRNQVASGKVKAEDALTRALKKGDVAGARAASDVLFEQGGGGVDKFTSAMAAAQKAGGIDSETLRRVKENITSNHGQYVKSKAANVISWAGNPDASTTIEATTAQAGTWTLSASDLATQTGGQLLAAAQAGNISPALAKEMLEDKRIAERLDDNQKEALAIAQNSSQEAYDTKLAKEKQDKAFDTYVQAGNVAAPVPEAPAPSAQERAQATINTAAQGSAGSVPFVVDSGGTVAPNSAAGRARTAQQEAAAGGGSDNIFVVDRGGSTEVQPPPAPGSYVDEAGRQTPNSASDDYHDGMNR